MTRPTRWAVAALLASLVLVGAPGSAVQGPAGASGTVRIAYPDEPVTWHPASVSTTAATDLAALWGLPLYRVDGHGQLRAGLAAGATVDPGPEGGPWTVRIELRPGTWSDGAPVTAEDVVATLDALRGTRYAPTLEPLVAVEAAGDRTVHLRFDRPYGRWPYLLAGGLSVLPAHVLGDGGLAAYEGSVPVSGGAFHLESHEPGLRATFVANPRSPLGPPGLERVEVHFTPDYETALGLVADGRAEMVLGHLALNPVERALRIDGVDAAAPFGGTTAVLRWAPDGPAGDPAVRQAARDAIDLTQLIEGLLGPAGAPSTSTIPGHAGPWDPERIPPGPALQDRSLGLLVPGHQEVPTFTGRVLQRDLRGAGADPSLVRVEPEDLVGPDARTAEGTLLLRRDLPRPALLAGAAAGLSAGARASLAAADAAATNLAPAVDEAQAALHAEAFDLPLYQVGVAHAWRQELGGVRPSSWPGLALWDVAAWRWTDDPPAQRSTSEEASDASG